MRPRPPSLAKRIFKEAEISAETPTLSAGFKRLYCDEGLFASYGAFHPVNFRRVLPFQGRETILDDHGLLLAEEAIATCGRADDLVIRGHLQEAKRLLWEASMFEPDADIIKERLQALP